MQIGERPACPVLVVGDKVIVRRSPNDMRGRPRTDRFMAAEVVKAGRVWLTIRCTGTSSDSREWRMRRDTQDQATQYSGSNASFVTPEQHDWDERMAAVDAVIRDADVRLSDGWQRSEIWTPDRRTALADFIVSLGVLDGRA